jgi:hypothetical protein
VIIAAGIVRGDGSARAPVYNDLKGGVAASGEFTLTFKGYQALKVPTNDKVQVIVKAMVVQPTEGILRSPLVMFKAFQATRILLSILDGGTPVNPQVMALVELMVEISMFEAPG